METKSTGWITKQVWHDSLPIKAYQIEQRKTAFGVEQRHSWLKMDGSVDVENWIKTPFREIVV